jgi:hypothetical protein
MRIQLVSVDIKSPGILFGIRLPNVELLSAAWVKPWSPNFEQALKLPSESRHDIGHSPFKKTRTHEVSECDR